MNDVRQRNFLQIPSQIMISVETGVYSEPSIVFHVGCRNSCIAEVSMLLPQRPPANNSSMGEGKLAARIIHPEY